jgi:hypothetical protein
MSCNKCLFGQLWEIHLNIIMSSGEYWGYIDHFEGKLCRSIGHVKMVRSGSEELKRPIFYFQGINIAGSIFKY